MMLKFKIGNFSFIISALIISYSFWNIFIRERLPKVLSDFASTKMTNIIFINLFTLSVTIITTLYIILSNNTESPGRITTYLLSKPLIKKIVSFLVDLSDIVTNSYKSLYELIVNRVNISHMLEIPFASLSSFLKELPKPYAIVFSVIHIVFHTTPRLIPPIIFLLEICYFHQLNFFYKSLLLYAIPLIYNALLWILSTLSDDNMYYATAHIDIDYSNKDDFTVRFKKEIPCIPDSVDIITRKDDHNLLCWFAYIYDTYLDIKWLTYRLEKEKKYFINFERLVNRPIYLTGWVYILFYVLQQNM